MVIQLDSPLMMRTLHKQLVTSTLVLILDLRPMVKTLTNSLDRVLQMRGVEYDRIDLEGRHQIGVISTRS